MQQKKVSTFATRENTAKLELNTESSTLHAIVEDVRVLEHKCN